MQLEENELKELSKRLSGAKCPICGGTNIIPNGLLLQELSMMPDQDGQLDFSGRTKYMYRNVATASCHDCGFVMHFLRLPRQK